MTTDQSTKNSFSVTLKQALFKRYHKLPSAAFVAREFNLRAPSISHVNQESARKWLRGMCIPELNKLFVIQDWLQIDLNSLNGNPTDQSLNGISNADNGNLITKKKFLKQTDLLKRQLLATMNKISDLEKEIID